jgi:hypothetical protein
MSFFGDIAKGAIEGIIGPLFSLLSKKEDVKLETFKVNGVVDVEAVKAHVEALRLRRDLLVEAMKYKGIRFFQYAFMTPLAIWFNAVVLACLMKPIYPWWPIVHALPGNLDYILSGIIAFLFAGSKIDEWVRRTK